VSKSGTLGDATLATPQKGRLLVDALVSGVLDDIEKVRTAPLPMAKSATPPPPPPPVQQPRPREEQKGPGGCTPGDDRIIREIGNRFSLYWSQLDAESIAGLFTKNGDVRHPDGTIERGREIILSNRTHLFIQREYFGSKHPVQLNDVRCLSGGIAIADGKWELRLEDDPQKAPGRGLGAAKTNAGWCTLIMIKGEGGGGWAIEAWRYTVNPPAGAPTPTLLSKPGYIGRGDHQPH
jgi:hypothetical protein